MVWFIDVEASAFNGFPIEIGWLTADLSDGWSTIILPTANWVKTYPWDKQAELLHGLKWRKLMNQGMPPKEVAERLNADLAGAEVYSDAPEYDGKWLALLFAAAGITQGFSVKDATAFIKQAAMARTPFPIGYGDIAWGLFLKASGQEHRALDDAVLMSLHMMVIDVLAGIEELETSSSSLAFQSLIDQARAVILSKGRSGGQRS